MTNNQKLDFGLMVSLKSGCANSHGQRAAADHIEKLQFVLSFDEFSAREKIWDLLSRGDLELTPDLKLIVRK